MQVKTLSIAVAAAIYSASAAHAVGVDSQLKTQNQLKAPNITFEEIKAFSKEYNQGDSTSMMQNDGLNVQLSGQNKKFTEEGLDGEHIYIVRLRDNSVALEAREFDSPLAKTMQTQGVTKVFEKGQPSISAVTEYQNKLLIKQRTVMQSVTAVTGRTEMRRQFTKALNGFSVKMTEREARSVAELGAVASVMRSKNYDLLSDEGPRHIGADQVWDGTSVPSGIKGKGEGQIVGIIDTGINSDHPSFAAVGDDGYEHINPFGSGNYVGDCVEEPEEIQCNSKLIGVRSYDVITDAFDAMIPGWPAIGEDYQGHGSHVASTAAGNVVKNVPYMLPSFGENTDGNILAEDLFPEISGVAPHANIIAYQVCYPSSDEYRGCPGEALVAGIEDAISDGVDVINFSIGGADSNVWADPVQLAFLAAREAGINVAAAAGNSGQGCGSAECFGYLDNSSPWLAQVAATTHGRSVAVETAVEFAGFADASLGSEVPSWSETGLVGGAINSEEITGVVVWAKDYEDVNGFKDYNGYCTADYPENTFNFYKDGTEIAGAADGTTNVIVICQRHLAADPAANARTAKVDHVKAGGADGFIMYNRDGAQGTVAESYSLPGVHFTYDQWNGVDGNDGLEDWVDSYSEMGHMITIKPTVIERRVNAEDADWLATFSSRGPSFSNIEVLAPTLAAPGVDIYAAYSDEHPFVTPHGQDYAAISGTSMASPHVAGSMALLRQIHPDWTAAEVQSALSMTAENVVKYHRLNNKNDVVADAKTYRSGAGRINVALAAKAGFVMDESADNFLAADPFNGGTPHKLNLPNLVNFSCAPECQWVRTIKATEDGTWTVSHEDVENWSYDVNSQSAQNGVNIDIFPKTFSLKKGETQTIIVKASIMDTQDWFSNSEVELHTNLVFQAEEAGIPDAHWPVAFKYDRGNLPSMLSTTAHSDEGTYVAKGIMLPNIEAPVARVYEPVKAEITSVTLPKDDDTTFPWTMNRKDDVAVEDILDEATFTKFVTVPANSKRFIAETVSVESELDDSLKKGNPIVYVGKDYNGDGIVQPQDEILCVSNHRIYNNFCNINNPEEGEYWVVLYSSNKTSVGPVEETFELATAVVSEQVATGMTARLPASDGLNKVDMTVDWNMEFDANSVYYSLLDVGTSAVNPGNLGSIPFKINRGKDVAHLDAPNTGAKVGDFVPYTFEVLANNSGVDREFTLELAIPEGLDVKAENVAISTTSEINVEVVDGKVVVTGMQADTRDVEPDYIVTDNITDEMCRTPDFGNANPGGYVDLSQFGIMPLLSGFDDKNLYNYRDGYTLPIASFYNGAYDNFSLYNNTENTNIQNQVIQIRGMGTVNTSGSRFFYPVHNPFPYHSFPFENMGPLWRGWEFSEQGLLRSVMSVGLSSNEGISLASTATGWGIVEWDNASDYDDPVYDRSTGTYSYTKRDNSFDFQVLFNANTRFGKGEHEIYYAYDNLDFGTTRPHGSIGLQGFRGEVYEYGPLDKYRGVQVAYNNLDEVISDDYVVCMDYVGPESSQFEVTAWAEVLPSAAGQMLNIDAKAAISGLNDMTTTATLSVPSNITVVALDDMVTTEETAISFDVHYIDETNSKNEISVISDNVSFEVDGDTVTVTPNENFYGETEVTVVVSDIENPSDAASTTFMLTVTGVSDAPVANVANTEMVITEGDTVTLDASASMDPDGDELSYSWQGNGVIADASAALTTVSGLTAGDHVFTVTVSDGELETSATVNVKVVTVAERLAIDAISNQSVDEDNSTEIAVNFDNQLGKETVITAMADNAEVEVMGHETGSMLKLTPAANFNGEIEVTVMVAYTDEPSAVAQTTFTLTVNAVNDAPVVELAETHLYVREGQVPTLSATASDLDGDELTYEWTGPGTIESANSASTKVSGLVAGDYVYTVTVSDGTTTVEQSLQLSVTEAPEVDDSDDDEDSSGSLAWLTLLMAGFAGLRRRKAKRS
ncbi:S8 family serine peptidase [Pseudoalteromonas sp. MT33b]|uniref:S8 family serine peptidase n=1 Tax=Pseudoalteromonas sp. MT33b TaxID=2759705 RepID=UPI0015FE4220|nr:S8 family serine peptidase [Pseudoalteromonas sp. MT33b]QMW15199.1 S8 family serine peptidase [Pseudoalteromonas sp. MT33b]